MKCEATRPQDKSMLVGPIGRYTTGMFDHVDWDMFRAASDDDIEAYSDYGHVFHQEVYRGCSSDQNHPHLPQPKNVD